MWIKGDPDKMQSEHKVTPLSNYAEIFRGTDFTCPSSEPIENVQVKSGSLNFFA